VLLIVKLNIIKIGIMLSEIYRFLVIILFIVLSSFDFPNGNNIAVSSYGELHNVYYSISEVKFVENISISRGVCQYIKQFIYPIAFNKSNVKAKFEVLAVDFYYDSIVLTSRRSLNYTNIDEKNFSTLPPSETTCIFICSNNINQRHFYKLKSLWLEDNFQNDWLQIYGDSNITISEINNYLGIYSSILDGTSEGRNIKRKALKIIEELKPLEAFGNCKNLCDFKKFLEEFRYSKQAISGELSRKIEELQSTSVLEWNKLIRGKITALNLESYLTNYPCSDKDSEIRYLRDCIIKYDELIHVADRLYNEYLFKESYKYYYEASMLPLNEDYPSAKIRLLNNRFKAHDSLFALGQKLMLEGFKYYRNISLGHFISNSKFSKSSEIFKQALDLLPRESVAKYSIDSLENEFLFMDSFNKGLRSIENEEFLSSLDMFSKCKLYKENLSILNYYISYLERLIDVNDKLDKKLFDNSRQIYKELIDEFTIDKLVRYPHSRIKFIDKVKMDYFNFKNKADYYFNSKEWKESINMYSEMIRLMPNEGYDLEPSEKIKQCSIEIYFDDYFLKGISLFDNNSYDESLIYLSKAIKLASIQRDNLEIANSKIIIIQNTIQSWVELKDLLNSNFKSKLLYDARIIYNKMNDLMPYRKSLIQFLINEIDRNINSYESYINLANLQSESENDHNEWKRSISNFQKALELNLNQQNVLLSNINKLQSRIDAKYTKTFTSAEDYFIKGNFSRAKEYYNLCLNIKDHEISYLKEKINECNYNIHYNDAKYKLSQGQFDSSLESAIEAKNYKNTGQVQDLINRIYHDKYAYRAQQYFDNKQFLKAKNSALEAKRFLDSGKVKNIIRQCDLETQQLFIYGEIRATPPLHNVKYGERPNCYYISDGKWCFQRTVLELYAPELRSFNGYSPCLDLMEDNQSSAAWNMMDRGCNIPQDRFVIEVKRSNYIRVAIYTSSHSIKVRLRCNSSYIGE